MKPIFSIESSSEISNLNVNHTDIKFKQSKNKKSVTLKLGPSENILAKDIVISYSSEQIRDPNIILTKSDIFPGKIAAHISFIPRISEEHYIDEGKLYTLN